MISFFLMWLVFKHKVSLWERDVVFGLCLVVFTPVWLLVPQLWSVFIWLPTVWLLVGSVRSTALLPVILLSVVQFGLLLPLGSLFGPQVVCFGPLPFLVVLFGLLVAFRCPHFSTELFRHCLAPLLFPFFCHTLLRMFLHVLLPCVLVVAVCEVCVGEEERSSTVLAWYPII